MTEDEAKAFARWWLEQQVANYNKLMETSIAQMRSVVFDKLERRANGRLEDDYFRGMEETADSFVEGLRDSMQQQLGDFDEVFAYQWYAYQKHLQEI